MNMLHICVQKIGKVIVIINNKVCVMEKYSSIGNIPGESQLFPRPLSKTLRMTVSKFKD